VTSTTITNFSQIYSVPLHRAVELENEKFRAEKLQCFFSSLRMPQNGLVFSIIPFCKLFGHFYKVATFSKNARRTPN